MFLFEYRYESEYADNETAYDNNRSLLGMALRSLAGDGTSAALRFDTADRQQRIAYFFCISTAVVWACLDIMALIHCGWAAAVEAFQKSRSQLILSLLLMARGSLIVWLATLCLYETHPRTLSLLALAGVSAQLVLRVVTFYVLPRDVESEQTEALGKSLQYTAARLRMPSQP